jgi:amino acid transporter
VLVSGLAGWIMLSAIVLATPDMRAAAEQGPGAFFWILRSVLPRGLVLLLCGGIVIAQYLCGLATVTSASRMAFAFARDGGLPASRWIRRVDPRRKTPVIAIWMVTLAALLFTVYTPVYSTITAVCTIFLYVSYVLPIAIGLTAHGRTWTQMGPWRLGRWFPPLALLSVVGCLALLVIAMQPPNEKSRYVVAGTATIMLLAWRFAAQYTFAGPPAALRVPAVETALESLPGISIPNIEPALSSGDEGEA